METHIEDLQGRCLCGSPTGRRVTSIDALRFLMLGELGKHVSCLPCLDAFRELTKPPVRREERAS